MGDVAGTENIMDTRKNLKLEMRLRKYNVVKTSADVMLQDNRILKEESLVIEFDRITREFNMQDNNKYSLLQILYWEGNVNHISRSSIPSFITAKTSRVISLPSKII